ncbi:HlyD family efflux transporter periplasmic adaptor subunit [Massilia cavernae]|uniref:HlyD family efflux transporter periplasmic adaptor subunit n=1 Tax=Massilia cavernae TaxID=2320864 RepID=A0A418XXN9_9BURK|nr:HlyD family efflux transporter periplasmic adaptor subunit [Massilia cavernae]RJG17617.1 HlyD family efflux transporter periplasmic adaptor subunit [Massilia cavernae]
MTQDTAANTSNTRRRNRLLLALAGLVAITGVAGAAYWRLHAAHFVSTDNAYAGAEIAQVTPAVGGTIAEVRVKDTQAVRRGQVLVTIDRTDAELALAQAEAELGLAMRRVRAHVANDEGLAAQFSARKAEEEKAGAMLDAAKAEFERARVDLRRREALSASGSVSGDELTRAKNAFLQAQASLEGAKAATAQARANSVAAHGARQANAALIANATQYNNPEVALARARRDRALIDLERTVIRAPVDGVVAKRQVQLGQRVQAGTPLLSVVPVQDMHVMANFKEVQLENVRAGQRATLTADVYGSSVTYNGVVEGFSGGSGAAFAAIPAQNATGNWIKVVQRLPVRIRIDPEQLRAHPLKVGLSMTVEVDTATARKAAPDPPEKPSTTPL